MIVKPKKYLGQHFLNDEMIAQQIADALTLEGYKDVLEIGPGMGVLDQVYFKETNHHTMRLKLIQNR